MAQASPIEITMLSNNKKTLQIRFSRNDIFEVGGHRGFRIHQINFEFQRKRLLSNILKEYVGFIEYI